MEGIAVTGHGRVSAPPDRALLALGVSVLDKSAAQARTRAASAQQAVLDALERHAVAAADRQTSILRIMPEYDYKDGAQRLRGYRVTSVLAIAVRALDHLPVILDDVLQAGGEEAVLNGIEFDVGDRGALERTALEVAVADARSRGEALAAASGARLGGVVSIDARQGTRGPAPLPRMAMMAERASGTPIEPGTIDIEVTVDVTFAIA
jgi:hypothetical protein